MDSFRAEWMDTHWSGPRRTGFDLLLANAQFNQVWFYTEPSSYKIQFYKTWHSCTLFLCYKSYDIEKDVPESEHNWTVMGRVLWDFIVSGKRILVGRTLFFSTFFFLILYIIETMFEMIFCLSNFNFCTFMPHLLEVTFEGIFKQKWSKDSITSGIHKYVFISA